HVPVRPDRRLPRRTHPRRHGGPRRGGVPGRLRATGHARPAGAAAPPSLATRPGHAIAIARPWRHDATLPGAQPMTHTIDHNAVDAAASDDVGTFGENPAPTVARRGGPNRLWQGEMEKLFTATEVAELFQIHREVVYAEVKAGRLKAVRIGKGRNLRFRRKD